MSEQQTEEQVSNDRASIANEVFGDAGESQDNPPETHVEQETSKPEAEVDPMSAMRNELTELRAKVGNVDELSFRLKQAEHRLGGVQNELHAAREAAKATANAPTKEQIELAAGSKAEWESLQEDFPEWTQATDKRIAAERAETARQIAGLRQEITAAQQSHGVGSEDVAKLKVEMAENLVSFKHSEWKKIQQTEEFGKWWNDQLSSGRKNSYNPNEVIAVFDDFDKFKSSHKSSATINAERQARLQQHQTKPGHKLPPTKSEADMSISELRAAEAARIWAQT